MSSTSQTGAEIKLESLFRSDSLFHLRDFLSKVSALRPLFESLLQIRLIVDANIIQAELRWRLAKRQKADARSSLHESIDSGLVVAFAPVFLKDEIKEHIHEIANSSGATLSRAMEEWEELQRHIHFYQAAANCDVSAGPVSDIDDLPYKHAYEELDAAAVYSRDADFQRMNVPVIRVVLDLAFRKHARASSVVVHITVGSIAVGIFAIESLQVLGELVSKGLRAFGRLPAAVHIGLAAIAIGLLIHPKSRERIVAFCRSLSEEVRELKLILQPFMLGVASEFITAVVDSADSRQQIQSALPPARKRSAIMHARAVCVLSNEPLSVSEIDRRIRLSGYVGRSRSSAAYLKRLLRASGQFVEQAPGMWSLQQVQA